MTIAHSVNYGSTATLNAASPVRGNRTRSTAPPSDCVAKTKLAVNLSPQPGLDDVGAAFPRLAPWATI